MESKQTTVNMILQNFLTEIKTAKTEQDYKNLWETVWNEFSGRTNATKAAYTSRFRQAVKAEFGDEHPILPFIKVNYTELGTPFRDAEKSNAGRKPVRKALINNFVDFVKKSKQDKNFTEQLTERWKSELADMFSEKMTDGSILNAATLYRKALRDEDLDTDTILAIVKAPDEVVQRRNQAYQNRVFSKQHKLIAFPLWQEMVEELNYLLPKPSGTWSTFMDEAHKNAKDYLEREDVVKIGVILTLFTGRRTTEIFCQGRFSPVPIATNNKNTTAYDMWHVNFLGQAKTRGQDGTMFDTTYTIPTLTHSKTVLYAHELLRSSRFGLEWQNMTAKEFKDDLLRTPAPRCIAPIIRDELLKKYWPTDDLSFSGIRTIYAEIADVFFRPKNMTKAAFVAKILGHSHNDLETANSYMKFYLPDVTEHGVAQSVKTRFMKRLNDYYNEQKEKYPQYH